MKSDDSELRQREKDAEYLRACREHGIEAEPPHYNSHLPSVSDEAIDAALNEGRGAQNGRSYRIRSDDPEPLKELPPEAEALARFMEILLPVKRDPCTFVNIAGRRLLCLSWLLGRRRESLSDLARELKISRASLSSHVRLLEDKTGLHGRGQKGHGTIETYRENAKRSWKLRKLNDLLAAQVEA